MIGASKRLSEQSETAMLKPVDQVLAVAAAEARSQWRSPLCWILALLVAATGLGAYLVLAEMHAELYGFTSNSSFVSPRFLVHFFGIAPLWVLLFGMVLLGFDTRHRDQRVGFRDVLDSRPFGNLIHLGGQLVALTAIALVVLLLTFAAIQILGAAARAFDWPFGALIEPVSLATFLVVEALPALVAWGAAVLLLSVAVRNRLLVLLIATGLLGAQHWLLHAVPIHLLPAVSPLAMFGTVASDVLPTFPSGGVLAQRVFLLMLAGGLLMAASALHPRPDGRSSSRLAGALASAVLTLVAAAGVTLLAVRSTDATALREQWLAAQRAVDGTRLADLERIKGSVRIDPGNALAVDVELALSVPSAPLAEVVFSLNPGMEIHELLLDGESAEYRHASGLLTVRPHRPLKPGAAFVLSVGATGVPDPRFAYLDEAVDAGLESWNSSQLTLLGTVASIFDDDYVALMPHTRWLPMPGPNLAADPTRWPHDFTIDLAVEVPDGWHVAGPGKGEATGSLNRLRFAPEGPLYEARVVAAPFERFATTVGGVEFELLLHRAHLGNVKLLADAPGVPEALVNRLAEFVEEAKGYGLPYPYGGLSVVEAPARLRLYGGGWRMESVQSGPGVLLMREHGFPTARLNRRLSTWKALFLAKSSRR